MITNLKISKLYDRFNYDINLGKNDITIITGPNGFGKTTILNIIDALGNSKPFYFYKLKFEQIEVSFDGNEKLIIKQLESKNDMEVYFDDVLIDKEILYLNYKYEKFDYYRFYELRKGIRYKINNNSAFEEYYDTFTLNDYDENSYQYSVLHKTFKSFCKKINDVARYCDKVNFISEQRLIVKEYNRDNEQKFKVVLTTLPDEMKEMINSITADYSKVSNSLDASYPQRLLSYNDKLKNEDDFREKLDIAMRKFNRLKQYNLVDYEIIKADNYKEEFSHALKVYFDDFDQKYEVFRNFIDQLDLYTDIINSRLNFKKIIINRENGISIFDENTHEKLDINKLSSGEKQEIILFYNLIFKSNKGLVLLIDEPEISLHIIWQSKFIDDLDRVCRLRNIKAVVATHSPAIIKNRWNEQTDLGELYGSELD